MTETTGNSAFGDAVARAEAVRKFMAKHMISGEDYGIIPSAGNKPSLFKPGAQKLMSAFGLGSVIKSHERIFENNMLMYEVTVTLINKGTGQTEAEGVGCCSSGERRYSRQSVSDVANTLLKMAKKRALVDAVIDATGASCIFTQDVEDMDFGAPQRSAPAPAPRPNFQAQPRPRATAPAQPPAQPQPRTARPTEQDIQQLWVIASEIPENVLRDRFGLTSRAQSWNLSAQQVERLAADMLEYLGQNANRPAQPAQPAPTAAPEALLFEIPQGTPRAKCRSCGAAIYWIKTRNGKNMPVNADGSSHFSTCPNAEGHRRTEPRPPAPEQPQQQALAAHHKALFATVNAAGLPIAREKMIAAINNYLQKTRGFQPIASRKQLTQPQIATLITAIETGGLRW